MGKPLQMIPINYYYFSSKSKKDSAKNPFVRSMEDFREKRYGKEPKRNYDEELKYN